MKHIQGLKWQRGSNTYGINKHQEWDVFNKDGKFVIHIRSNEDVLGDKWYMTNGEGCDTIWYTTKENALKAFLTIGKKAIRK